jgi:hypothetical protein
VPIESEITMNSSDKVPDSNGSSHDQFELRVELTGPHTPYADSLACYLIEQSIYINGERLAPEHAIYLIHLAKSCQLSGEFFIVTCDCCGDAGCAGIDDGIRVTHFGDRIEWEVPDPISYRGMSREQVEQTSQNRVYKRFSFQPNAYLSEVQEGLRIAKGLLFGEKQPVDCSPDGLTPELLLSLDPIVFNERGATIGCLIVADKVAINGGVHWIVINGISYHLREFPVPEDVKALDYWSDWEPKPCGPNGLILGDLAAPVWERRRRIRLLANYLASMTLETGMIQVSYRGRECKDGTRVDHQLVIRGRSKEKSRVLA